MRSIIFSKCTGCPEDIFFSIYCGENDTGVKKYRSTLP
ncbi:hypothetical protein CP02DC15_0308 [Chlamydia psittaci 02DC15]|nr:hypothetical protein CP02DC15_0308 [Chlamydia psittaci 02DC15]EPJ15465.1 hypothetical protein CP02DC18_1029 [Chlamydia psittaci 02DC18]EPJ97684.1 hypothetical protein CP02DC14_1033 [Chlamydia psittaci 02DC14]EPL00458.1 hypothetical protein CP02DC24_0294 [Chlamydia psittaci 02DC24]